MCKLYEVVIAQGAQNIKWSRLRTWMLKVVTVINAEARTDNAIRPLSHVLQEKRIKLLGHIVRRPREHPQHQTTFCTRSLIPRTVDKRRVGRPRLSWTHETMKVAWNLSHGYPLNVQNREMRRTLQEMAQNRIPPFD